MRKEKGRGLRPLLPLLIVCPHLSPWKVPLGLSLQPAAPAESRFSVCPWLLGLFLVRASLTR